MRRISTTLSATVLAMALTVPTVAFAQEYPPPEGPVEVLPTTIDKEPQSPEQPAPAPAPEPAPESAPEPQVASDQLPRTGADAGLLAALAAGTIVIGGGAVVATRRKREQV